jgi:hypothetical protein
VDTEQTEQPPVSTTERLKRASKQKAEQKASAPTEIEQKPLAEFNTLAPVRPFVTVDDVRHDFRLSREFGLIEHQEFVRDSHRYDYLWQKGIDGAQAAALAEGQQIEIPDDPIPALSLGEGRELEELQEVLFAKTLVDPGKLRDQIGEQLTGIMKREILLTFTNAPLLIAMAQQRTAEKALESSSTTAS